MDTDFRPLSTVPGAFVSIYFDDSHDTANAGIGLVANGGPYLNVRNSVTATLEEIGDHRQAR